MRALVSFLVAVLCAVNGHRVKEQVTESEGVSFARRDPLKTLAALLFAAEPSRAFSVHPAGMRLAVHGKSVAARPSQIGRLGCLIPRMAEGNEDANAGTGEEQANVKKKVKVKGPKQKNYGPGAASMLKAEQTFFEGAPSATECIIPGLSSITVVGLIPFAASLSRQAWTRYKITNRRIEVKSGFQGKDTVQIIWNEITDIAWLRRYGGAAGDLVLTLKDGSKLEIRSIPDFERNLAFIINQISERVVEICGYPDGPAKRYIAAVESGELPKPELADGDAPASSG